MSLLVVITSFTFITLILVWFRIALAPTSLILFALCILFIGAGHLPDWGWAPLFVIGVIVNHGPARRYCFTRALIARYRHHIASWPDYTPTNQSTWLESPLVTGELSWQSLSMHAEPRLTCAEQSFIDGPIDNLCRLLSANTSTDKVWRYIFNQGVLTTEPPAADYSLSSFAKNKMLQKVASVSPETARQLAFYTSFQARGLLRTPSPMCFCQAGQKVVLSAMFSPSTSEPEKGSMHQRIRAFLEQSPLPVTGVLLLDVINSRGWLVHNHAAELQPDSQYQIEEVVLIEEALRQARARYHIALSAIHCASIKQCIDEFNRAPGYNLVLRAFKLDAAISLTSSAIDNGEPALLVTDLLITKISGFRQTDNVRQLNSYFDYLYSCHPWLAEELNALADTTNVAVFDRAVCQHWGQSINKCLQALILKGRLSAARSTRNTRNNKYYFLKLKWYCQLLAIAGELLLFAGKDDVQQSQLEHRLKIILTEAYLMIALLIYKKPEALRIPAMQQSLNDIEVLLNDLKANLTLKWPHNLLLWLIFPGVPDITPHNDQLMYTLSEQSMPGGRLRYLLTDDLYHPRQ